MSERGFMVADCCCPDIDQCETAMGCLKLNGRLVRHDRGDYYQWGAPDGLKPATLAERARNAARFEHLCHLIDNDLWRVDRPVGHYLISSALIAALDYEIARDAAKEQAQ